MASDFDRNNQQSGQQHGDPNRRADQLDDQLKRKQPGEINNPQRSTARMSKAPIAPTARVPKTSKRSALRNRRNSTAATARAIADVSVLRLT